MGYWHLRADERRGNTPQGKTLKQRERESVNPDVDLKTQKEVAEADMKTLKMKIVRYSALPEMEERIIGSAENSDRSVGFIVPAQPVSP